MLDKDVTRLSEPYLQRPQPDEHSLLRLADPLAWTWQQRSSLAMRS